MLPILKDFFNNLEEHDVRYVHWKSNERLHSFLNGESDLDLLFSPVDRLKVHEILKKINAKKYNALGSKSYENIEDYLAVDDSTGRLIHFHIHFQLDIGEKGVKRYPVPWLKDVLDNRIKDESSNVWITSHEHEILLLIVREALRIPPLKSFLLPKRIHISDKSHNEFEWLKSRCDEEKLSEIINSLFQSNKGSTDVIFKTYNEGLTVENLCQLGNDLSFFRKKIQTTNDISTVVLLVLHRFKKISSSILKRIDIYSPTQRINSRGGSIIVLTGSDGSGKSTTVQNLYTVFSRKIDVVKLYFGTPKPEKSNFPKVVSLIGKLKLKRLHNLYVKKRNLKKALKLKEKGVLVLCDRFPQSIYPGNMDGPLCSDWKNSKNFLKKWFFQFEKQVFQKIE